MKVNWAWLSRMAATWRSGTARDFPGAEQAKYRASLGLPPTPAFEQQPRRLGTSRPLTRFEARTRTWVPR